MDSGAQISITGNLDLLTNIVDCVPQSIIGPNGSYLSTKVGCFSFQARSPTQQITLTIPVYYVFSMSVNLISLSCIYQQYPFIGDITLGRQHSYFFYRAVCFILGDMARSPRAGLWQIQNHQPIIEPSPPPLVVATILTNHSLPYWHYLLGHCNADRLLQTLDFIGITPSTRNVPINTDCETCHTYKASRHPLTRSHQVHIPRTYRRLALLHSDTSGSLRAHQSNYEPPAPRRRGRPRKQTQPTDSVVVNTSDYASFADSTSFLLIIDDYSRFTWVFSLSSKHTVPDVFKQFIARLHTRFPSFPPSQLISDKGTEFTNSRFAEVLSDAGIEFHPTPPDSPQSNSVSERRMRTVKEGALSLLKASHLPIGFLSYAIEHFVHINNYVMAHVRGESFIPWLRLYTHQDDDPVVDGLYPPETALQICRNHLANLHQFGVSGLFIQNVKSTTKTYDHAVPAIYLGYSEDSKRLLLLLPLSGIVQDAHYNTFRSFTTDPFRYNFLFSEAAKTSKDGLSDSKARLMALVPIFKNLYDSYHTRCVVSSLEDNPLGPSAPSGESESLVAAISFSETTKLDSRPDTTCMSEDSRVSAISDVELLAPVDIINSIDSVILPSTRSPFQCPLYLHLDSECSDLFSAPVLPLPYACFHVTSHSDVVHPDFHATMHSPDRSLWTDPCLDEINSLQSRKVFSLVHPPADAHILGCRWVLTNKQDSDGVTIRRKARLVAQGFTQIAGRDYDITYAEVTKCDALFVFLQLCAQHGLALRQIDVKTAFLYAPIDRDIYVRQPPLFDDRTSRVWKLHRALYGLKQSPRLWMKELSAKLETIGFNVLPGFQSIFTRKQPKTDQHTYIVVYVDDILIADPDSSRLTTVVKEISTLFEITDLGEPTSYLSLHIERSTTDIRVDTRKSIRQLVADFSDELSEKQFKSLIPITKADSELATALEFELDSEVAVVADAAMLNRESQLTPQDLHQGTLLNEKLHHRYRSAVGSLNFLVARTRPDIAFATSCLSHRYNKPRWIDWRILLRVLHYLQSTPTAYILFRKQTSATINIYSDASFMSKQTKLPQVGFVVLFGDSPIIWKSRQDKHRITSIHRAECYALNDATKYMDTILPLFELFGLKTKDDHGNLFTDSESNVKAYRSIDSSMDHYLNNLFLFCKEHYFLLSHIPGTSNLADLFTKALHESDFRSEASRLIHFE